MWYIMKRIMKKKQVKVIEYFNNIPFPVMYACDGRQADFVAAADANHDEWDEMIITIR